jgi:hypothetical protein
MVKQGEFHPCPPSQITDLFKILLYGLEVSQMVQHLSHKYEDLNSKPNPSTTKNKTKKEL